MIICKRCSTSCDPAGVCPRCGALAGFEDDVTKWEDVQKGEKEAESSSPWFCPRCWRSLTEMHYRELVVEECPSCGGTWFDKGELARALAMLKAKHEELSGAVANRGPRAQRDSTDLSCPKCHQGMSRCTFEGFAGVAIDRCEKCGLWFDKGEIDKLFAHHLTQPGPLRLKSLPWYSVFGEVFREIFT